jgi:hypothetical protein
MLGWLAPPRQAEEGARADAGAATAGPGLSPKAKTTDGLLVVEVGEPNAGVYFDGEEVTVASGDGGKKAALRVDPAPRKVGVKKAGFLARRKGGEPEAGGRRVLTAGPPPPAGGVTSPGADSDRIARPGALPV